MTPASRAIRAAFNATRRVRGEAVVFKRDEPITSAAIFIAPNRWQVTATAAETSDGVLQSSASESGPWSAIADLDSLGTTRLDGNKWFRLSGQEAADEVVWNISIEIAKAVRGATNWEAGSPFPGLRVGSRSVDWLVLGSDIVVQNSTTALEPKRDDKFVTENGETFKVIPFGANAQLWNWHDRTGRSVRRIFTEERT